LPSPVRLIVHPIAIELLDLGSIIAIPCGDNSGILD